MTWRVAKSLLELKAQLDAAYPHRSTESDGFIGDAAHQQRHSDHNPWVIDHGVGVVTAGDYTHDPAHGLDCNTLATGILQSRDPRVKYVIWDGRIWRSYDKNLGTTTHPEIVRAWTAATYTGVSRHKEHLHLSVNSDREDYDSRAPWRIVPLTSKPTPTGYEHYQTGARPGRRALKLWSAGDDVAFLQRWLSIEDDGYFGPKTVDRVKWYQHMRGLQVDGIVGDATWRDILQ